MTPGHLMLVGMDIGCPSDLGRGGVSPCGRRVAWEARGGTLLARRLDPAVPGGEVYELLVPNAVYPAFAGDVARLGRWVVERQAAELPDPVRVVVHVSE